MEALWWRGSVDPTWQHLPWWEIEQAFWRSEDEQLRVVVVGQIDPLLLSVSPDSRLPEVVRERVMASILSSLAIPVASGVQVTFRVTPDRAIAQSKWAVPQESEDPRHQQALAAAVRESAGDLGIDL
jgi:hypothetical protein